MQQSLTLSGLSWARIASFVIGLGMMVASILTIKHFYDTNFPNSIYEGSFCDINAFFNCDSSAYSAIAAFGGVPLGYFGMFAGALLTLGAVFPTVAFERSNKMFAFLNVLGVGGLLLYSVFILGSLCLLCAGYYVFAILGFFLFWKYGIDKDGGGFLSRWFHPSAKLMVTFAVVALLGAFGFALYTDAKLEAQDGGVSARVVEQYYSLPEVAWPSIISPYMYIQSTEKFGDAPIQVVFYGDLLCPDCMFLFNQLERLKGEVEGKINIAYQFFPLEAKCNDVVDKDSHPGACDLSYMAAYDPSKFQQIQHEIHINQRAAKKSEWRVDLAKRYGVEAALEDEKTKDLVHRIIKTGAEYEKTSDRWAHGIRSTPTLIINNRMVIGTFPYPHLRAIFKSLIEKNGQGEEERKKNFMEHWVPTSGLGG
jgi:uncharacterized membrane protein/predicted DsbA family dithiol-disulfide isomerase